MRSSILNRRHWHNKKCLSLRSHLLLLMIGAVLPTVVFASLIVFELIKRDRAIEERHLLFGARALLESLDREIEITFRTLETLIAESDSIYSKDLSDFYGSMSRVHSNQPDLISFLLLNADGKVILDTNRPFGMPPRLPVESASLKEILRTKRPIVGTIAKNKQGELGFAVRIPVFRNGDLIYVLTAIISSRTVQKLVATNIATEKDWVRVVLDKAGTIVARSREPELYVGSKKTPEILQLIEEENGAVQKAVTLDGHRVYMAFSRSSLTGWTTAVAVPLEVFEGPMRKFMTLVLIVFALMLAIFGSITLLLARRIAYGIESAASAAGRLAVGDLPRMASSPVAEIQHLRAAIFSASKLLIQRNRDLKLQNQEAHRARKQAESANKAKDRFLAMLGHELRNPVGAISNGFHLLRLVGTDKSKVESTEVQAIIDRQIKHLTRLIDDLLDASRISQGKISLRLAMMDLKATVSNVFGDFIYLSKEAHLKFELTLPEAPVWVLGDETRLSQCIGNLIHNACKFTSEGGVVNVELKVSGEFVRIIVKDTGCGIDPSFLPMLFQVFVQESQRIDRGHGGLGLGLAVVKGLVEMHNGSIHVQSEGLGKGTVVTMTLPLRSAPFVEASHSRDLASAVSRKILIIEDQHDAADSLQKLLSFSGHDVRVANEGIKGLEGAREFIPDVVICDIGLPDIDGYEVARRLRSNKQFSTTLLIALSGYGQAEDVQRAKAAGFNIHIAKPTNFEVLFEVLKSWKRQ